MFQESEGQVLIGGRAELSEEDMGGKGADGCYQK